MREVTPPKLLRVQMTAVLGFAVAIIVLAGGTAFGIARMNAAVRMQERHLLALEREGSRADQIQQRADLVWSVARAYVDFGDPGLLDRWDDSSDALAAAQRAFGQTMGAQLPRGAAVISSVSRFLRVDSDLRTAARQSGSASSIRTRFDQELRPLRDQMVRDLDEFGDQSAAAFRAAYVEAEREQRRLRDELFLEVALLVAVSLAVAAYVTRHLSRAFRNETAATEAARRATAARDELMGVVAHDLRNPLAAITLKAALLREQTPSDATRKQAESIETIALRMEYLIQTMLDITTLEAGRFSVQPASCAAEDLVRDTAQMFDRMAESKRIELEWHVTPPWLAVWADRDRVLQVLTNLVGNAVKYTPAGGHVAVTVELDGEHARFAIADTGPGIAADDIPKVFDRFWRKGTTSQKGTGLGLFIAKAIVEAHGGRIWVESEPGRGTTFCFTLGVARER